MRFLDDAERRLLGTIAALADRNPFLPERVEAERRVLGKAFVEGAPIWHAEADLDDVNPNEAKLGPLLAELVTTLRERLAAGAEASDADLAGYVALARYHLFHRFDAEWFALVERGLAGGKTTERVRAFGRFTREVRHLLGVTGLRLPEADPAHLFASGFQVRRAFHFTYRQIFGGSLPAARLRAAVWHSIFTHDAGRYWRALYDRMGDITTLVVGESGTGKELVARAIALSRWIPFDPKAEAFAADFAAAFHPLNLSALSPTLIESELFGHRRGAFTGAVDDRAGWLETAGRFGTVFLDEIGELDAGIQVKLLRVLQTRRFQRIGETRERTFEGKIIAGTNRDLAAAMDAGGFRRDFYYRLCADVITTPTLRDQLRDTPDDLGNLLLILARRTVGDAETPALVAEVEAWVRRHLGRTYAWPGNMRELEQCVRNVLIRGEYHPPASAGPAGAGDLAAAIEREALTAEELVSEYCTRVYARCRSYQETARILDLDRRTVKAKVDARLLARGGAESG